jgi:isopenicillin N synthase-like dioxygenase
MVGHAVPETLRRDVLAQARRFFARPEADKERCAIERSPNHRGYGRIAAEHLQPDIPSDLEETFDIRIACPADDPDRCPLEGPNQWPDLEGFRPVLEEYPDRDVDTVRTVLRLSGGWASHSRSQPSTCPRTSSR